MKNLKKYVFSLWAKLNKAVLPKVYKLDPYRLSKSEKLLVGYKYWVTKNALND